MSLFIRTPQRASLTPEGKILFKQIRRAMSDVQLGLDRLAEVAARRRGHVRIACAPTLASTRLGDILATFKLRYPRSIVEVKELPPSGALSLLQEQEVEFYIGPEIPHLTDFQFEPILTDRFMACIPPEYDNDRNNETLSGFGNVPIIMLDDKTAIRGLLDRIIADHEISLNIQYEVQNAHTALALASSGLGIAIVPGIAIGMTANPGYRIVPISDLTATRAVGIITARGYVHHSYSEQLMELIRIDLRSMA